ATSGRTPDGRSASRALGGSQNADALAHPAQPTEEVRDRGHRRRERVQGCATDDRPCAGPLVRERTEAAELLDPGGDARGGRLVEPVRAAEALDEGLHLSGVVRAPSQRLLELRQVLVEIAGDTKQAAVLPAQVVEVQRPRLR